MSVLLSHDKQTHLSHVILTCLKQSSEAKILGDEAMALREIKHILGAQVTLEQEIDKTVRARLKSYSRPLPEGSPEWEILYQKTYQEELRKRNL